MLCAVPCLGVHVGCGFALLGSAIALAHASRVWFSYVRFPCRWARCVWHVLLQHSGRSTVPVSRVGPRALVMHRSHFGSRYKLGLLRSRRPFLCAVVVVDIVVRAGVVCGLAPRAAAGGAPLARTHVSQFWVAPCVCMTCSVRVLWCGGLAAAFRFSLHTVRHCWQPLASRLPQEKYCYG